MKKTKKQFEEYLNELAPNWDSDLWIIGGKNRNRLYPEYGKAIRKYDPIAFEVGYREFIAGK